jgi:mitogen-activated protein kinase organizer 1
MPPALPSTLLNTISSHAGPINALTFSAIGGTYILTGSSDRQIHLSRTEPISGTTAKTSQTLNSSTPIQKYSAHGYAILDLACSSDNTTFASVGGDRNVFLWDVQAASTLRRFGSNSSQGHSARINCVAFAGQDDSVLISGSLDRSVRIWDVKSRNANPIMILDEAKDSVSSIVVPRTGYEIIAASVDNRVRSYDLRMGQCVVDTLPAAVTSVEVTRDGQAVLINTLDGRIRLLDRKDGTLLQSFGGGKDGYVNQDLRLKACFGQGEAVVIAGSEADGKVRVWDVVSGDITSEIEVGEDGKVVSVVSWRDNGRGASGDGVWASGSADGKVKIWGRR